MATFHFPTPVVTDGDHVSILQKIPQNGSELERHHPPTPPICPLVALGRRKVPITWVGSAPKDLPAKVDIMSEDGIDPMVLRLRVGDSYEATCFRSR